MPHRWVGRFDVRITNIFLHQFYRPHQVVTLWELRAESVARPLFQHWPHIDGRATQCKYVDLVCQAPITEPEALGSFCGYDWSGADWTWPRL